MDASDIINKLRERTVFYNLQTMFSTNQTACNPLQCGSSNNCSYTFTDYETRLDYFNGRYAAGSYCSTSSTCVAFCFQ
jgi:hypothetical protein